MASHNYQEQRLRTFKKIKSRLTVFCMGLIFIAILYFVAISNAKTDPAKTEAAKIKLSAQPADDQSDQINNANEIKGSSNSDGAKSVCLDPGHGGDDPGAIKGKITERDINLIAANKVKDILVNKGYTVYLTRENNDQGLSKADRYSFCNSRNASILVAVHHNTYEYGNVNYTTALYYTQYDQPLAESLAQSISSALKIENKGIAWFDSSVLSKSQMPAAFSEAFFMTNSSEHAKLARKDYSRLDNEAVGIAQGIVNYFSDPNQFKPTFAAEELKIDRSDW